MPERKPDSAMRRAAGLRDFLEDGARRMVASGGVAAFLAKELAVLGVEQLPPELVAERIPHDRIHADEPRREMADGKELHELHVDELRPGAERERVAVAAHVERRAVPRIEAGEAAGGDDRRLRRDGNRSPGSDMHSMRADARAIVHCELHDEQIPRAAYAARALELRAQRLRDGGTGIHEVDVHAARPVVPRRLHLADVAVASRPADAPGVEFADT